MSLVLCTLFVCVQLSFFEFKAFFFIALAVGAFQKAVEFFHWIVSFFGFVIVFWKGYKSVESMFVDVDLEMCNCINANFRQSQVSLLYVHFACVS